MSKKSQTQSAPALLHLCMGLRASQALYTAAKLGIADHLAERPMRSVDLAAATSTHAPSMRRLMRLLSVLGVFAEPEPDRFVLTPIGEHLRSGVPASFRAGVLFLTGGVRWRCWSDLLGSVRTGAAAAERVLGMQLFDYYAAHPEESAIHDQAMLAMSAAESTAIVDAYDFSRFRCVVDVGGGTGQLLADILRAHPGLCGILFDLPHVVAGAPAVLSASGLAGRCRVEGGSFFDGVPAGGDIYLLKHVIHDWDDARAAAILANCREVLSPDSTLLVLEWVLPERAEPGQSVDPYMIDLEMLVMTPGGRERTEGEFRKLLSGAGFDLERILATASAISIVEARPA